MTTYDFETANEEKSSVCAVAVGVVKVKDNGGLAPTSAYHRRKTDAADRG